MEYKEIINKFVNGNYSCTDNTCNGRCSRCGECCGAILPLDQEDINIIQDYIVKNKIFPQKHILVMEQKWQCPYYNGNKEKGCSIYEARPKICRIFKCDKIPNYEDLLTVKKSIPIDMWSLALAIEKEMLKNGIKKKTGKTTN